MKNKKVLIVPCLLVFIFAFGFMFLSKNKNKQVDKAHESILQEKNMYDASKEIEAAKNLIKKGNKAKVITDVKTEKPYIAINIEGTASPEIMDSILMTFDKYNSKGTFFITGIEAAEDTENVMKIKAAGHDIGSLSREGRKHMETLSEEDLISDYVRGNKILQVITGQAPSFLKCNNTKYTDKILMAAYASGNEYVVHSNHFINYRSFKSYEEVQGYVKKMSNGTILTIKLSGELDDSEYKGTNEAKPAIDKEPGISDKSDLVKENVPIDVIIGWLLESISENEKVIVSFETLGGLRGEVKEEEYITDLDPIEGEKEENSQSKDDNSSTKIDFTTLVKENKKRKAPIISKFMTTQEGVGYTFRGLSNEEALKEVLKTLKELKAKGTFFVTKNDLEKYPERINKIISEGHHIGNGGITTDSDLLNKTTEEIAKEIFEVDYLLKKKGINTKAYMPGYGYVNSNVCEAVSAVKGIPLLKDYELITYSKAPIINKYKDWSASAIVEDYLNINTYQSLQRGEIVYFRLDSEVVSNPNTVAEVLKIITENYLYKGYAFKYNSTLGGSNPYELVQVPLNYSALTISDMQNTYEGAGKTGRYKLNSRDNRQVYKGKRPIEEAVTMFNSAYIGNKYINLETFKKEEQELLDKSGTIDTKGEDVIFLTFDDWGGDPIINEILKVLDKHKVKGSFFVISKNVEVNGELSNANPNLLRSIALKGHDIGSHNYFHERLDLEKTQLEEALVKSYGAMHQVIGDLSSLKSFFRPPELVVERDGLSAIYESGFDYSVGGNISTHDYESESAEAIVDTIINEIEPGKGNIIVMHMNNQSFYTPEALDIFLTNNENGVYGKKYKIASLSEYLK